MAHPGPWGALALSGVPEGARRRGGEGREGQGKRREVSGGARQALQLLPQHVMGLHQHTSNRRSLSLMEAVAKAGLDSRSGCTEMDILPVEEGTDEGSRGVE